jgi:Transglutaminase-like superfamily
MSFLLMQAFSKLLYFDLHLSRGDFATIYETVRSYPLGTAKPERNTVERINRAIGTACIWYWKEARCLQRSATTACLLKKYGVPAQLVIGVQQMPFKAHAWVEVHGRVVNDKPYTAEMYLILDRC